MNKIDETMEEFGKKFVKKDNLLGDNEYAERALKEEVKIKYLKYFLKTKIQSAVKDALENTRLEKNRKFKHSTHRAFNECYEEGYNEAVQDQRQIIKNWSK